MKIPKKENIDITNDDDPMNFYYYFGIRKVFLSRLKIVLKLLGKRKFQKMLDIGYGSGLFFSELNERSAKLFGIDTHQNSEKVDNMLKKEGLQAELQSGNILNLPYEDERFDGIVCISILEHISDLDKAVNEIKRVLTKDGIAVISFPVKNIITDLMFNSVGYDHKMNHVSSHIDIVNAIKKKMDIEKVIRIPGMLPIGISLYMAVKCTKK